MRPDVPAMRNVLIQSIVASAIMIAAAFTVLYVVLREPDRPNAATAIDIPPDAERCARAETEFAAAKAGRPLPDSEPTEVLSIIVWDCRGRPEDTLPADL